MSSRFSDIEVFVRVVETGSFALAAAQLHLSPSAVSKTIARIEERLGLPLAIRSTRKLRLTAEGEDFYARGKAIVSEVQMLERTVRERAGQVAGTLRVSCNIPFGLHRISPLVPEFLAAYPGIQLDLQLSDAPADLIRDGIDIAIRTGVLADSTIRARRLDASARHVVAAPAYLARHGMPAQPADLLAHNCLTLGFNRNYGKWPFRIAQEGVMTELDLAVRGNLMVDNGESLRRFALAGVGVARLSEFHIGADIAQGRLVPLLEGFNPGDREPVSLIYSDQAHLSARIRAFVDFIAARL
ncbi:LysR family transcriptional regulator [Ensifer soli]|uniref:LysR family transcriptional regulator n=1 Tax=Ciceribacter sp. sgz301302 TaxID=3342379 RepID=UPI0035BB265D